MENMIEARVILGILCFIHLFLGYAGASGAVHSLVNKKVLNGLILTELILVTVFVVFDNLQTPPHDGWPLAILGYLFVYGLIVATWWVYNFYTFLKKDKIYEMTIDSRVRFSNKDYLGGVIFNGKREIEVLLPYKEEYLSAKRAGKINVRFRTLLGGHYIVDAI